MIAAGIISQLTPLFKNAQQPILYGIRADIINGLQNTHEYEMLLSIWRGDFGFEKGTERIRLDSIIGMIANSVEIEFKDFKYAGGKITGGLYIHMLIANYSDILLLKSAFVANLGKHPMIMPWLDWFLNKGGSTPSIIGGYHVIFGASGSKRNKNSRSGIAIMGQGGYWRVPGDGSPNDNWLTRFFTSSSFIDAIENRIIAEIG